MAISRFKALDLAQNRPIAHVKIPDQKISEYYGCNTFNDDVMKSLLSPEAYKKISDAILSGSKIDRDASDEVEAAMK